MVRPKKGSYMEPVRSSLYLIRDNASDRRLTKIVAREDLKDAVKEMILSHWDDPTADEVEIGMGNILVVRLSDSRRIMRDVDELTDEEDEGSIPWMDASQLINVVKTGWSLALSDEDPPNTLNVDKLVKSDDDDYEEDED